MAADLAATAEPVRRRMAERHEARERAYGASREAIRAAAHAIRALHRGDDATADELLATARAALAAATDAAAPYPDVTYGGFLQDAAKEYAEAALTAAAIRHQPLPGPDELGVDDASWLLGLAETVGELRRRCLDLIRADALDDAEVLLALMEDILAVLVTVDAPDAITRGLRRATDAARSIAERTRGDVTAALGQRRLREALDAHRHALEGHSG